MQFMLLFEAIRQDRSRIFGAENDEIAVRKSEKKRARFFSFRRVKFLLPAPIQKFSRTTFLGAIHKENPEPKIISAE
ncbi:hypothetical protein HR17_05940 [Porphyromonas gulae]|uniref:Uncharacterized protein n=1 Tax=Porphyromonas gulae TaxID=111105 RepID=A0A099WW45_9PORP|nr:hypothetical protein HQ49_02655 [Porphyromonas gulae]KGN73624.1 hypothetical protein HQ40_09010 [Porphyromonas gulae]KGN74077.1 hypothetical protein HR17_05940 [Porphyromonas gulae]KGN80677.1 hypothetical protein HR13_03825 [Porphyromonas gulae]KGN88474.1 hypothetical protein HQ46_06965 [Porphyromonas gulae]